MAKGKSKIRTKFWRTDWFLGLIVVMGVLFIHVATDLTETLERRFYDFASTSTGKKPGDKVAIIAIDDQSIRNIGRWPWPRDVQAKMIDLLAGANAKVIVNTIFLFEPEADKGLGHLRKIKDYASQGDMASSPLAEGVVRLVTDAQADLDNDTKLALSIKKAGNVLLASTFELGQPKGNQDKPLPAGIAKHVLRDSFGLSAPSTSGLHPLDRFVEVASG